MYVSELPIGLPHQGACGLNTLPERTFTRHMLHFPRTAERGKGHASRSRASSSGSPARASKILPPFTFTVKERSLPTSLGQAGSWEMSRGGHRPPGAPSSGGSPACPTRQTEVVHSLGTAEVEGLALELTEGLPDQVSGDQAAKPLEPFGGDSMTGR